MIRPFDQGLQMAASVGILQSIYAGCLEASDLIMLSLLSQSGYPSHLCWILQAPDLIIFATPYCVFVSVACYLCFHCPLLILNKLTNSKQKNVVSIYYSLDQQKISGGEEIISHMDPTLSFLSNFPHLLIQVKG